MNKSETIKSFSLGAVLTITTRRLLCDIGDVYKILNHVTGDNLYTHVLPRAIRFAAPLIIAKYPDLETAEKHLAKLDTLLSESPMAACKMWLDWISEPGTCGLAKEYAIASHANAWLQIDPSQEPILADKKVIAV